MIEAEAAASLSNPHRTLHSPPIAFNTVMATTHASTNQALIMTSPLAVAARYE